MNIKAEYKVFHISELRQEITFESTISNTELNSKEGRALMIFDMISRLFGSDHNLFSIGNVMTTKTISIENAQINETIIDEDVVIIKDSESDKVYVDRSIVDLSSLSESLDETFVLKDVQFILKNLEGISESINLLKPLSIDRVRSTIVEALANMN